jgi:hypothetical protein
LRRKMEEKEDRKRGRRRKEDKGKEEYSIR